MAHLLNTKTLSFDFMKQNGFFGNPYFTYNGVPVITCEAFLSPPHITGHATLICGPNGEALVPEKKQEWYDNISEAHKTQFRLPVDIEYHYLRCMYFVGRNDFLVDIGQIQYFEDEVSRVWMCCTNKRRPFGPWDHTWFPGFLWPAIEGVKKMAKGQDLYLA